MPRRSRGALLPPVQSRHPRRADVYLALRDSVMGGTLSPGERLPSTRKAAADYGVSRGLLEEVYAQLTEEGFLERVSGGGTYISRQVPRPPSTGGKGPPRALAVSSRGARLAAKHATCVPLEFKPFNAGIADTAEFPWKTWQKIQVRAVRDLKRPDLDFTDPRGLPALRRSIAHHLAQLRGLRCSADEVIVFNSGQQAL